MLVFKSILIIYIYKTHFINMDCLQNDISSVLNNIPDDNPTNKYNKKNKYKKPMELTELEHRTSILNKKRRSIPSESEEVKDILPFIDKDITDIYKTTWNKLERGQRLNRVNIFIHKLLNNELLPASKCKRLRIILHTHISNGKINKNTEVNYDSEKCEIESIKGLIINTEDGLYKFTLDKSKKSKPTNKSKSNVDRFLRN
jgi:hypothetical protein